MDKIKEKVSDARDKIIEKLPDKLKKDDKSGRITNDTVAEHREKILAGGRKFKYPFQYSKHKVLINVIVLTVAVITAFSVWIWAMLYKVQTTHDFFYAVVRVLPVSVANVDGENVQYQDYMRRLRADIYYKEVHEKRDFYTEDGQRELNYLKRKELDGAERVAYAVKIARKNNISVTNKEIDDEIEKSLVDDNGSKMTLTEYEDNMLRKFFGWSMGDYRSRLYGELLRKKVMEKVKTFDEDFDKLKKQGKIHEYIKVPEMGH
ncbi:SurA N-terminal domain-containing protein [Candidatus Saccharibacteria bacterium]|nr:SurA N-terminal domain-containing protein [Candidatus Saccharibacteria bacterium]MCL1963380.1 SurA N-terminal domain-containing protein [Candidatus Saccharibacteria bacterium]